MKNILYIILVFGMFACNTSKKNSTSDTNTQGSKKTVKLDPKNPVLLFQKTPCFGTCPIYNIVLYGDGRMTYTGKRFVKLEGDHEFEMSQQFITELLDKAEEIKFFEMQELYDQNVTDLPSTVTTIDNGVQVKKVKARAGIPDELKAFNRWIHNEIMKVVEANAPKTENNEPKKVPSGKNAGEAKPALPLPNSK